MPPHVHTALRVVQVELALIGEKDKLPILLRPVTLRPGVRESLLLVCVTDVRLFAGCATILILVAENVANR